MNTNLINATATGDIVPQGKSSHLLSLTLSCGAVAGTIVIRTGGAAGTIKHVMTCPINTTASWTAGGEPLMADGIHLTVTGASAFATIEYTTNS